jgi:hypothetical protein
VVETAQLVVFSLDLCQSCPSFEAFSCTRYCLQHSPVPVVVVHPYQRRLHRKHKREKDPERHCYINLLKLANVYNPSTDSLVPSHHNTNDIIVPGITLETPDTPDSLSPDEEAAQTQSEAQVQLDEGDQNPGLRPSITPPAQVDPSSTDVETALERQRENVSLTDKG